jgi:hypothetical protein
VSRAYVSRLVVERHWFRTARRKRRVYRHPYPGHQLRIRWLGVALWFGDAEWGGNQRALAAAIRVRDNMIRRNWRRAPEQARRYLEREGLVA